MTRIKNEITIATIVAISVVDQATLTLLPKTNKFSAVDGTRILLFVTPLFD